MRERAYGLHWRRDFPELHRKPRTFPDWDVSLPGFDACVRPMAAWVVAPDVAYNGYWDDAAFQVGDGRLSSPLAAMRTAFSL